MEKQIMDFNVFIEQDEDGTLKDIRMHYYDLERLLVQDHGTAFRYDF